METSRKIQEWAQKLEYKKTVPVEIKNICNNPSTVFLWEQLVANVIPKQQVDHVRHNIILNRLRSAGKKRQTVTQYPIKELEVWKKKQKLLKEVNILEENVQDLEQKLGDVTKCLNIKYVRYKKAKLEVKENEEKQFLYERKSEQLKKDILQSEEKLSFFRNLTPVEEAQNKQDVAETLKRCAEKIQRSLDEERLVKPVFDDIWLTPEKKPSMHGLFSDDRYPKNELTRSRLASKAKCFKDDGLLEQITKILHENNTNTIWSVFLEIFDQEKRQLEAVMSRRKFNVPLQGSNVSEALTNLRVDHIRNEFKSLRYDLEINRMNLVLDGLEEEIYSKLEALNLPSASIDDIRDIFLLQKKEAGLTAFCNCIRRQLDELQADLNIKTELNSVKIKSLDVQQELIKTIRELTSKVSSFNKIYHALLLRQEETTAVVRKLSQFTQDLKWTLALTNELHSKEVRVFLEFPLEYNRQISVNGRRVFARNTLREISCDLENVDTQSFQSIMNVIESPHCTPEYILYHLLQRKRKFNVLRQMCSDSLEIEYEKFSIGELLSEERYVHDSVEKLQILLRDTLHASSKNSTLHLEKIVNLWMEMPFGEHLSSKRYFNGENVAHYQKLYDSFYDRL